MPSLFTDPPASLYTQRPSRLEQLQQLLTPEWAKPFAGMSPEQANKEAQTLNGPQAPGKIGPGYLSDTQRLGMAAGDIASLAAPEAKVGMAAAISPGLFQAARKALPMARESAETATRYAAPAIGLRSDLRELAWGGKEGLAASKAEEQRLVNTINKKMESFWNDKPTGRLPPDERMMIPGYHWENGKLVPDT